MRVEHIEGQSGQRLGSDKDADVYLALRSGIIGWHGLQQSCIDMNGIEIRRPL